MALYVILLGRSPAQFLWIWYTWSWNYGALDFQTLCTLAMKEEETHLFSRSLDFFKNFAICIFEGRRLINICLKFPEKIVVYITKIVRNVNQLRLTISIAYQ